ncbi:MAG TPA: peptidylprolyl isomerase [Terriglobales bacterium]|jgi:peptidyl-prolyl cis-trans isomerase SurA|nr:peptidylprolyl isomerase [Terriglobales bacterium]
MKKTFLFAVIVSTLPGLLGADTVVEEIIARVNNQIITRSEYLRSREQLKQDMQQQNPTDGDRSYQEKQRDVLRDLIDQQLLLEKGKDLGITADTELVKSLDEMRKQMNLESMEDLEKAAESQGISFEDFKQNRRNQIITQQVIGREVGSHLSINKEEEQQFYDQHRSEMERPEQIRLSEIIVAPKAPPAPAVKPAPADPNAAQTTPPPAAPTPGPEELAAAEAKAKDLHDQIAKGGSFEDIAKKNSDGPSAAQGGDLGYFKRGVLAKELEDKTFAMKAGEITDVVRTKQGFVILKVTEHQDAGIPPMKDVEPRIQDALYMQKLQPALRTYLTKLREDAFIDIKAGYVDTGASPNQTKFIETNTKEADAKKLKKKKKFGVL